MRRSLLIACLALTACGSNDRSATIDGTTYTSSADGDVGVMSGPEGKVVAAQGAAAAKTEMPASAPQYPGSKIASSIQSEKDGHKTTIVSQTTSDPVAKVADFYRASMKKAGLKSEASFSTEEAAMLSGEGPSEQISVIIGREGDVTTATVSTSAK